MTRPAVFLDRDGTLNREVHYLSDPADFAWIPGAVEALQALQAGGFALVVTTNQSGIAQGMLDSGILMRIHQRMQSELLEHGVCLDGIYHCPHHPDRGQAPWKGPCDCRKPGGGMIRRALRELDIQAQGSWIIGDSLRDLDAGKAWNIPGVLVRTGKGSKQAQDWDPEARLGSRICDDILAAAEHILATVS